MLPPLPLLQVAKEGEGEKREEREKKDPMQSVWNGEDGDFQSRSRYRYEETDMSLPSDSISSLHVNVQR